MKRKELVDALKVVLPGVDQKNVLLEGSDSFVFDGDWLKTFNDHLSVSYRFPTGLKCMAKADVLFKTISKMDGEEVDIKIKDQLLTISNPTTELTLPLIEDKISAYIENFQLEDLEWFNLPPDFLTGLALCYPTAAKDSLFGSINSVFVNKNYILSSDNFRISTFELKEDIKGTFMLPVEGSRELVKFFNLTKYAFTKSWIHFMSEEKLIFSMKLLLGDYPIDGLKKIIDAVEFKNKYTFPEKIGDCLERAGLLSVEDETIDYVLLESKKGTLHISGERQYGRIEEKLPLPKGFPDKLTLKVSPKFLNSVLSRSKDFYLHGSLLVFKSDNYLHIVSTVV